MSNTPMIDTNRNKAVQKMILDNEDLIATETKAISDSLKQKGIECTLEQYKSALTSIMSQNDQINFKQGMDATSLAKLNDLEWFDIFVIKGVPSLKKTALQKVLSRKSAQLGVLVNYKMSFYDETGAETFNKDKVDSAQCVLEVKVIKDDSEWGKKGDTHELTGPRVYKEDKTWNCQNRRGLQDASLRSAIRAYFPEFIGSVKFQDEIEAEQDFGKFEATEVVETKTIAAPNEVLELEAVEEIEAEVKTPETEEETQTNIESESETESEKGEPEQNKAASMAGAID